MRTFGLIGYPLKHSFSPKHFKNKFETENITDSEYHLFELENIEELESLIEDKMPIGINVTIPYKKEVLPYLTEISPAAQKMGAVNTIKIIGDKRIGYNTDVYGFEHSLKDLYGGEKPEKALILGTGGAAQAVQFVLDKLCIDYKNVSRREGYLNYADLNKEAMAAHQLIVNTTPLGTYPNIDNCPDIPYHLLTDNHMLYDLVYNPSETKFMSLGLKQGAKVKNGLQMLQLQAEESWRIWHRAD